MSNDPRLVSSQALAKAQDLERRLNALVPNMGPEAPSIMYAGGNTVVTQSVSGSYTWTAPAGVTAVTVECWGAGAGGDGGDGTHGGGGGGGGEYTSEPNYQVVPGQVYNYYVGSGGQGGTSGNDAADGESSSFDLGTPGDIGVLALGGSGSATGVAGGGGGNGSASTIEFRGGNGGSTTSTGGGGGGASGSPFGAGGAGTNSTSSSGTSGGAGGTDKGAGGAGGNAASNGTNGSSPGGGGGGAGAATGTGTFKKDYYATASATYFGSDAIGGNANQLRNSSLANGQGTMTQGGETANNGRYNGTMKALFLLDSPTIQSDLSGVTITKVTVRMENEHTWYNSGMFVILGYANFDHFGATWNGASTTGVKTYWQTEGSNYVSDVTNLGLGNALKAGTAKCITLGNNTQRQMDLYNYGYFFGASSDTSQAPRVHVEGNTGGSGATAGNGSDGQIRITYAQPGGLVAAVQPASGTDANGNAFAAGYTGSVSQVQPGSSPALIETWHSFAPLATGFNITGSSWNSDTPYADYKLLPDGSLKLRALINVAISGGPGGNTWKVLTGSALPAAYRPPSARYFALTWSELSLFSGSNNNGGAGVLEPSGNIQVFGGATNGSSVTFLAFEVSIDLT